MTYRFKIPRSSGFDFMNYEPGMDYTVKKKVLVAMRNVVRDMAYETYFKADGDTLYKRVEVYKGKKLVGDIWCAMFSIYDHNWYDAQMLHIYVSEYGYTEERTAGRDMNKLEEWLLNPQPNELVLPHYNIVRHDFWDTPQFPKWLWQKLEDVNSYPLLGKSTDPYNTEIFKGDKEMKVFNQLVTKIKECAAADTTLERIKILEDIAGIMKTVSGKINEGCADKIAVCLPLYVCNDLRDGVFNDDVIALQLLDKNGDCSKIFKLDLTGDEAREVENPEIVDKLLDCLNEKTETSAKIYTASEILQSKSGHFWVSLKEFEILAANKLRHGTERKIRIWTNFEYFDKEDVGCSDINKYRDGKCLLQTVAEVDADEFIEKLRDEDEDEELMLPVALKDGEITVGFKEDEYKNWKI